MKRKKLVIMGLVSILFMTMNVMSVYTAEAAVYSQVDITSQPYTAAPDTYLITSDSVLTWKKYNTVLGYNDMGTQKVKEPVVEVYEKRSGDKVEGTLEYSWTFDGSRLLPIPESKKGPIELGITAVPTEDGLSVCVASKRVFDGTVTIKLNVSSYFTDGDSYSLSYIDGVDKSQLHGSNSGTEEVLPYQTEDLMVKEGFIVLSVSNGGNFKLRKSVKTDDSTVESMDTVTEKSIEEDAAISEVEASSVEANVEDGKADKEALIKDNVKPVVKPVNEVPKTGSDYYYIVVLGLALLSGVGYIMLSGKKN